MKKNPFWDRPLFLLPLSITLTILGLFCISLYAPYILATNDDLFRRMIVSGEFSGTPSPYMIYGHYLLGLLLSGLYSLTRSVPWYGLFCLSVMILSLSAVIYRFFRLPLVLWQRFLLLALTGFGALVCFFRQLIISQYTVTSALSGAAALFLAMTLDLHADRKSLLLHLAGTSALAVCSYLIRDDSFYMLLPFAGILWLCRYLTDARRRDKAVILRYLSLPIVLGALTLFLIITQKSAYSGADWKEFTRYNENRETIFDYYGFPDYEENRELYTSLGITEESLTAISTRYMTLLDSHYNGESMERLAEVSIEQNKPAFDGAYLKNMLKDWRTLSFGQSNKPLNYGVLFGYLIILLGVCITRDKNTGLLLTGLAAARTFTWLYLLYKGRYPERVTQSLFLTEFMVLLALLALLLARHRAKKIFLWTMTAALLLTSLSAASFGRKGIPQAKGSAAGLVEFSATYQELKDYCMSHPENFYFLDVYTVAFYTEPILQTTSGRTPNYLALGSWASTSPLSRRLLTSHGIEDAGASVVEDDSVYLIFLEDETFSGEYLFSYYRSVYPDASFTLTDSWSGSNGVTFAVYKGSKKGIISK